MRMRAFLAFCLSLLAVVGFGGCDSLDKTRLRIFGLHVCAPEEETAEWVLSQALHAAADPDEERGWAAFQKLLHSSERTPAALRSWREGNWSRMRRQVNLYLDSSKCFNLVDFREMQGEVGYDYFVANKQRDLPTPCSVYTDANNNNLWRIKRCSL
jgi:hypothetical protein